MDLPGADPLAEATRSGRVPTRELVAAAGGAGGLSAGRAALLESLDSKRVRVGLLSFSGEVDPKTGRQITRNQRDAKLEVALTHDYDRVRRALADRKSDA